MLIDTEERNMAMEKIQEPTMTGQMLINRIVDIKSSRTPNVSQILVVFALIENPTIGRAMFLFKLSQICR